MDLTTSILAGCLVTLNDIKKGLDKNKVNDREMFIKLCDLMQEMTNTMMKMDERIQWLEKFSNLAKQMIDRHEEISVATSEMTQKHNEVILMMLESHQ